MGQDDSMFLGNSQREVLRQLCSKPTGVSVIGQQSPYRVVDRAYHNYLLSPHTRSRGRAQCPAVGGLLFALAHD
jgi:hypothetical protein